MDAKAISEKIVEILDGKKAKDITVINIKSVSILADYFVICSGTSITHIKTLSDEVEEQMGLIGFDTLHKEGYNSARWILMEYDGVIAHIFHEEDRSFYKLERLWADGITTQK